MNAPIGLAAALLLVLNSACHATEPVAVNQVKVTGGIIEGTNKDGLRVFKGIPFAEPPVGDLRWRAPRPVKPWEGVKPTREFGPAPMQDGLTPTLFGVPGNRSEDCLYLNVWSPAAKTGEKLPVMVWIHGGGFSLGSTSQDLYDGSHLAGKGVLVVSLGYRVGAFGFLAHPELSREGGGSSGNYGLRDLIAGLEWVRDNIAAFGGDPGCVTLFGESAGGEAVSMLAVSPKAKGLFHRAISQSGGALSPPKTAAGEMLHLMPTLQTAEQEGAAFLTRIKAKDIAAARALPAKAILQGKGSLWPTYDGEVLTGDSYKLYQKGTFNDTPILVGTNSDDGGMFVLNNVKPTDFIAEANGFGVHTPKLLAVYPHATEAEATRSKKDLFADGIFRWNTWAWAKLQAEKGKGKAFLYYYDHPAGGAGHASEIPFVFCNPPSLGLLSRPWSVSEKAMSDLMSRYWINFARTGNPNGPGLPEWPAFTAASTTVMTFDGTPGMKVIPNPERLQFLDAYFAAHRKQAK